MKVMISRSERGRALIKTVDSLNLQDLSGASDDQIKAVTNLVWEIKRLFYALISGKASDVLADLNISCGAKLSANLVADLTASIPRDVVISAHQQWLPNLGTEMANRQDTSDQEESCWITTIGGWITTITESELASLAKRPAWPNLADLLRQISRQRPRMRPAQALRAMGSILMAVSSRDGRMRLKQPSLNERPEKPIPPRTPSPARKRSPPTNGLRPRQRTKPTICSTPRRKSFAGSAARPGGAAVRGYTAYAGPDGGKETLSANEQPRAVNAGIKDAEKVAQAEGAVRAPAATNAKPNSADLRMPPRRRTKPTICSTPRRRSFAGSRLLSRIAEKAAQPEGAARKPDTANAKPDSAVPADAAPKADAKAPALAPAVSAAAGPQAGAAPVISIESDVDPESWAEYGGWYRQDYAIFYRPTGHKDKFIYSWLFLTGPQAPKGDRSPAAAVFDFLTSKDAQGSCTKCHSVDDIRGKGRFVNFSPPRIESKQGRFTNFIHEPHFGILENRGCLTCHNLEKGRPYLQSYEQGNPKNFVSNFGAVKKELCQTCHTSSMARQDCLLCHKYHVNGVITPIMNTKIPTE